MKNNVLLFVLGLFVCMLTKANESDVIIYQLQKEFHPVLKIRVEVDTKSLGVFVIDKSRYYQGDARADKQLFCADNETVIHYGQPLKCSLVYWEIEVKKQSLIGIGARSLEDYYLDNGQWILSESKNFPRFRGVKQAKVCIDQQFCKWLPTIKDPFLFWVWGKAPTYVNISGKQFEVYSDKKAEAINKRKLMIQLEPNFRYLNKVFTAQVGNYIERPISVIMLAQDDRILKDAGGAAKDHVALVNYYTDGMLLARNWEYRFKETMLHEYIHLLAPCSSFPRWACESLADYYSYKALELGRLNNVALDKWQNRSKKANDKLGLYEIDRMYWQTKDYRYYMLFYVKGAAFWNELDNALNKKYRHLDSYLHLLILDKNTYQSSLPGIFTNQMIDIIGDETFNQLSKKYLD